MNPIGVAVAFVGSWLLIGLGVFCATGVRGALSGHGVAGRSRDRAWVSLAQPLTKRFASIAVMVFGIACGLAGLQLLITTLLH